MRHHRSDRPFDVESAEADDLTQEFWGAGRGWVSKETPAVDRRPGDDEPTSTMQVIKDGFSAFRPKYESSQRHSSGPRDRTRSHGIVRPDTSAPASAPVEREATIAELAGGQRRNADPDFDALDEYAGYDAVDRSTGRHADATPAARRSEPRSRRPVADADRVELSPVEPLAKRLGVGAVDPLLLRVGLILLLGALIVPFALAMRSDDDPTLTAADLDPVAAAPLTVEGELAGTVAGAETAPTVAAEAAPVGDSDAAATTAGATAPATDAPATAPVAAADDASSDTPAGDVAESQFASTDDTLAAATVDVEAERLEPECPATYEAGVGDSWYRIADEAGVTPAEVLAENLAQISTPIFPGDDICLPQGASMPSQPVATTDAPATTTAPAPATTDAPATTTAPAPTTTDAPTTTVAVARPGADDVKAIIRDVWPDELEDKAIDIAWRESNWKPWVDNGWCCYGLFQIYWTVHDSWLDDYDIHSTNDLLDARKNAEAAYALYQRSGGWGPWGG